MRIGVTLMVLGLCFGVVSFAALLDAKLDNDAKRARKWFRLLGVSIITVAIAAGLLAT